MNQEQIKNLFVEKLHNRRTYAAINDAIRETITTNNFALPIFQTRLKTIDFYERILTRTNLSKIAVENVANRIWKHEQLSESELVVIVRALVRNTIEQLPKLKPGRRAREPLQQLAISINAEIYQLLDERAKSDGTTKTAIVEAALKEFLSKKKEKINQ